MTHLRKLVRNKSVSLVGPSPILLDKGLGERIDSSDIVIRCGTEWPGCGKAEDARSDIGFRSDVALITDIDLPGLKSISERFDLQLLLYFWGAEPLRWSILKRYLKAMEIPFEKGEIVDGLYACTSILWALAGISTKEIYLAGINYDNSPDLTVVKELVKDPRMQYADHVLGLSEPQSLPL